MADQLNNQPVELPGVLGGQQPSQAIATPTPSATLPLATASPQTGVVQEALAVLMNTNQSPYQMASQFARIKESHIAQTYGIIIE